MCTQHRVMCKAEPASRIRRFALGDEFLETPFPSHSDADIIFCHCRHKPHSNVIQFSLLCVLVRLLKLDSQQMDFFNFF